MYIKKTLLYTLVSTSLFAINDEYSPTTEDCENARKYLKFSSFSIEKHKGEIDEIKKKYAALEENENMTGLAKIERLATNLYEKCCKKNNSK